MCNILQCITLPSKGTLIIIFWYISFWYKNPVHLTYLTITVNYYDNSLLFIIILNIEYSIFTFYIEWQKCINLLQKIGKKKIFRFKFNVLINVIIKFKYLTISWLRPIIPCDFLILEIYMDLMEMESHEKHLHSFCRQYCFYRGRQRQ